MKSVVPVVPEQEPCLYCDGGDRRNERLISCKDCKTAVHPSCLNYPEDLTDQIYSQVLPLHHLRRSWLSHHRITICPAVAVHQL